MNIGIGIGIPRFRGSGAGYVDPVTGSLVNYLMDGNDANLTPVNSPTNVAGVDQPDLLAAQFNGVDQYYTAVPDSSVWGTIGSGVFTISFWFNSADLGINRGLISTGSGGATAGVDSIRLRIVSGGNVQFRTNGTNVTSAANQDDGTNHHCVFVSLGSGLGYQFYIDGVADTSGTMPTYNIIDTNKFFVGAQDGGASPMNGEMDGVRIYNTALSAEQAEALFNNT
jgi:hypothetical protein